MYNQLKIRTGEKMLLGLGVVFIVSFLAPRAISILVFQINYFLKDGWMYPLLNFFIVNIIVSLFIMMMSYMLLIAIDTISLILSSKHKHNKYILKIESVSEWIMKRCGELSIWLCVLTGFIVLLRGLYGLDQIVILLFNDMSMLKNPLIPFFFLFILYSLKKRLIKFDFLEYILEKLFVR